MQLFVADEEDGEALLNDVSEGPSIAKLFIPS